MKNTISYLASPVGVISESSAATVTSNPCVMPMVFSMACPVGMEGCSNPPVTFREYTNILNEPVRGA